MRPVTKTKLFSLLRALAIPYLVVCALVGIFQRRIIYFPFHKPEAAMLAEAGDVGAVPWRAAEGAIIGWKSPARAQPAANRLVVFHGNAGYALHRSYYRQAFERLDGGRLWEVFLLEYPGYGARPGALGEASFIAAGQRALAELQAADSRPIFLLGESLGSGLASALAAREPQRVAGVFLITPFARLGDVAAQRYWFLPVRLMLRDPWDNVAALRSYPGPLAVLVAGKDEVVTAAQGKLLHETFARRKLLLVDLEARHNTVDFSPDAPWWREVSDFLLTGAPSRLSAP